MSAKCINRIESQLKQNDLKQLLLFVYEAMQSFMASCSSGASIRSLHHDSKQMLVQLFALVEQLFSWEFTSSKRKRTNTN